MFSAYVEIFIGEFVCDIPADSTEFSTILDDSMEKTESEEKFSEFIWFLAIDKFLITEILVTT